MSTGERILLCPGQGAQKTGMGTEWFNAHPASARTFAAADEALELSVDGASVTLSELCFKGPEASLNRTDISQPALYTCSVASYQGLLGEEGMTSLVACAGLSLGEWTALHLAGSIGFIDGLKLVALRGRLMQQAAEASDGSMVALIGADETQTNEVCEQAAGNEVLVPANYNAPGQIVISGSRGACGRAVEVAEKMGLRAKELSVAGAFHSPLMEPAAEGLAKALEEIELSSPQVPVWSSVTGAPHDGASTDSIKKKLVEQLTSPVRWAQCCSSMVETLAPSGDQPLEWHEMAPGTVLRGLFRRIDRKVKVHTHDAPATNATSDTSS